MGTASQRPAGEIARWFAALFTAGAAAIHFAVIRDHFEEYWAFGLFFALSGWAQMLWALAIVRFAHRRLLLAGIAANIAIAVVWALSRTTGLPIGPNAGSAEPAHFIDALATAIELLAALATWVAIARAARMVRRTSAIATVAALSLVVIAATTTAMVLDAGHANTTHHQGGSHQKAPHR